MKPAAGCGEGGGGLALGESLAVLPFAPVINLSVDWASVPRLAMDTEEDTHAEVREAEVGERLSPHPYSNARSSPLKGQ